jgi:tripartite motif-containing protein 2/3
LPSNTDIEFVSNFQAIQIAIRNTYGYLRQGVESHPAHTPGNLNNKQQGFNMSQIGGPMGMMNAHGIGNHMGGMSRSPGQNASLLSSDLQQGRAAAAALALASLNSAGGNPSFGNQILNVDPQAGGLPQGGFGDGGYEKWSAAGADLGVVNPGDLLQQLQSGATDPIVDLTSKLISANIYPPKSQIKRQKMIYHCKFGEFGVMEGQFTEPSGVAVNAQNDIGGFLDQADDGWILDSDWDYAMPCGWPSNDRSVGRQGMAACGARSFTFSNY